MVFGKQWLQCSVWKNGTQSCWVLEETNSVVFSNQSLQRTESNWWKTHGDRVEYLHRIHDSGHPQWDSENDGRITMWSSGLQMQDHLHVNVNVCKKKNFMSMLWDATENVEIFEKLKKEFKSTLEDFLAVIGLSLELVQKKKWYVTYDSKPNGCWDRTTEKIMQKYPKIWSLYILLYQYNNTFHSKWWQCSVAPKNGHLRQSTSSFRRRSGFDKRITRWSKCSRENPVALDQMEQETITQSPLAQVQANEERQGNLFAKLEIEVGTTLLCSSVTEWSHKSIFMPRIHVVPVSRLFQACACGECTSFPVSRLFQACACGECTSRFASRDCFKHALVVNTQAFPSRNCFKHALVVNTQAFPSRDCFKHALVVYTQAFPSRDCFKHALVVNAQAFPSRDCFKHALVVKYCAVGWESNDGCDSSTLVAPFAREGRGWPIVDSRRRKKHSHHHLVVEIRWWCTPVRWWRTTRVEAHVWAHAQGVMAERAPWSRALVTPLIWACVLVCLIVLDFDVCLFTVDFLGVTLHVSVVVGLCWQSVGCAPMVSCCTAQYSVDASSSSAPSVSHRRLSISSSAAILCQVLSLVKPSHFPLLACLVASVPGATRL